MGWNPFGPGDTEDNQKAQDSLHQAADAYKTAKAPKLSSVQSAGVYADPIAAEKAAAVSQGPTAYNGITTNPANNEAQMAQMAALSNLAKNGGRNAASDANLARIQQGENANARGQRDAIMSNMSARGMGGSGNDLLAQLSSSQNATNNQSARDMDVRGQEATTALQAGQGAAQIGAGMHAQDYAEQAQKAQAADAVNRFNAGNQQGVNVFNAGQGNEMGRFNAGNKIGMQEFNSKGATDAQKFNVGSDQTMFGDDMAIRGGNQQGGAIGTNYWGAQANAKNAAKGNMAGSLIGAAGGIAGAYFGGPAGAAAGKEVGDEVGDEVDDENEAWGGRIPGQAAVPGDSFANDKVKVTTSPGEVIVPRTLAKSGSKEQISTFVKNPPAIGDPNKASMLAALKTLRSRR